MKKVFLLVVMGVLVLLSNGNIFAADYVYKPYYQLSSGDDGNYYDLGDLNHDKAYSWGIDLDLAENEIITGVSLFFNDIRNWDNNYNVLFVSLLSGAPLGVVEYGSGGPSWPGATGDANYFLNSAKDNLLFKFEKLNTTSRDVTVSINSNTGYSGSLIDGVSDNATLSIPDNGLSKINQYAAAGIFGLGFDPDCHFYNNGIELRITTTLNTPPGNAVPEPATMLLFGAGLLGLASRMRKKK